METGAASRPKPGETECGDSYLVVENNGHVLVAVADGLGHGPIAAEAANKAMDFIRRNPDMELADMIIECGDAIRDTRGAALTLMRIDTGRDEATYAAVGNVEIKCVSALPIRPVNYPGIVGRKIRRLKQSVHQLSRGDIIMIYSDGVSSRLELEEYKRLDPQTMADTIVERHGKKHDDATCFIIRY